MHKRMQCTHVTDTKPATLVTIVKMCVCVQTVSDSLLQTSLGSGLQYLERSSSSMDSVSPPGAWEAAGCLVYAP